MMNKWQKPGRFSPLSRIDPKSRGVTIVEVLGALVLLGTVLVSILTAQGQFTRQLASAERRLEAVRAADHLLILWWQDRSKLPRSGAGAVDDAGIVKRSSSASSGLTWRTTTLANHDYEKLGMEVIRLEIFDARTPGPGIAPGALPGVTATGPLASVEIILPQQLDTAVAIAKPASPIDASHRAQGGHDGF